VIDIGIIGAMDEEIDNIVALMENRKEENVGFLKFCSGRLYSKKIAVVKCGIGKVFASICTEAMILKYSPRLIVNTGVGGGIGNGVSTLDTVIADKLCQHDMDTSALGDPKGLVSGINRIYFESDRRAVDILMKNAKIRNIKSHLGIVATGDKFVSDGAEALKIALDFDAVACEMEGCAVAQTAYVNKVPFVVVRAISDNANETASLSYAEFLPLAAQNSTMLTLDLIKEY
jgi:adenosylhomocysteine nucleosidase